MTGVCQKGEGSKSEGDHFVKKGIEFTERRNMQDLSLEKDYIPLKGALRRNQVANEVGQVGVSDLDLIERLSNGLKRVPGKAETGGNWGAVEPQQQIHIHSLRLKRGFLSSRTPSQRGHTLLHCALCLQPPSFPGKKIRDSTSSVVSFCKT
jgi:hypothetical protein